MERILRTELIKSPVLEIGSALEGRNAKNLVIAKGFEYYGADLQPGTDVNFVVDFEDREAIQNVVGDKRFNSILIFNVLEHVFDPIRLLDNAFSLLLEGGICVIDAPVVWQLHNYPIDCWRIMPNFYEVYCYKRSYKLLEDYFEYMDYSQVYGKVKTFVDGEGNYLLPKPHNYTVFSRAIHKLFNTFGRGIISPSYVSIRAVIQKC